MPIHILCADDVYYGNGSRSVQSDLCAVQFVVHDIYYVYNWLVAAYHPKACPQTPHVPWLLLACQINVTLTTSLPRLLALHRRPAPGSGGTEVVFFPFFFLSRLDIISKTENNIGTYHASAKKAVPRKDYRFRSKTSINFWSVKSMGAGRSAAFRCHGGGAGVAVSKKKREKKEEATEWKQERTRVMNTRNCR